MSKDTWFVIYCKEDDSHSLVSATCVVYDDSSVKVGDEVKFSLSVRDKKLHTGTISAFSDDYDDMRAKQDRLNAQNKPKRDRSFDADRPRLAAQKCKEKGFGSGSGKHSDLVAPKPKKNKSGRNGDKQTVFTVNPDESISSNSASSTQKKKQMMKKTDEKKSNVESSASNAPKVLCIPSQKFAGNARLLNTLVSSGESSSKSFPLTLESLKPSLTPEKLSVTDQYDDCESAEELTESEKALLLKISQKKKNSDLQALCALSLKKNGDSSEPKSSNAIEKEELQGSKSGHGKKKDKHKSKSGDHENRHKHKSKSDNEPIQNASHKPKSVSGTTEEEKKKSHSGHDNYKIQNINADGRDGATPENSDSEDILPNQSNKLSSSGGSTTSDSSDECPPEKPAFVKKGGGRKRRKLDPALPVPVFQGNFFRYCADSNQAVKLHIDYDVYINRKALKKIRNSASTATALARSLVRAVFSDEALMECSVSGKPYAGKGKDQVEIRPKLDEDGVSAILEYVADRAERKKWNSPAPAFIKLAMGNVLCEDRNNAKLQDRK